MEVAAYPKLITLTPEELVGSDLDLTNHSASSLPALIGLKEMNGAQQISRTLITYAENLSPKLLVDRRQNIPRHTLRTTQVITYRQFLTMEHTHTSIMPRAVG